MRVIYSVFLLSMATALGSCQVKRSSSNHSEPFISTYEYTPEKEGLKTAYFASGCFWCVEAIYESVRGVEESVSGYAGGHTEYPSYEASNTGRTGHAEAVKVYYDSTVVDFPTLLEVYFASQNVSQVNGQGPDHGTQYRSIVFYQNEGEKRMIEEKIATLNEELAPEKVAAEVKPFEKFWVAEPYHQDYEKLHPDHGYIQAVSIPRLRRFQQRLPNLIKGGEGHH